MLEKLGYIEVNGARVDYTRVSERSMIFFNWDDDVKATMMSSFLYDADNNMTEKEMLSFLSTKVNVIRTIGGLLNYAHRLSTTSAADIFVHYSPHVNKIQVRVYPEGWDNRGNDEELLDMEEYAQTEFHKRLKQGKRFKTFIDDALEEA